MGFPEPSQDLLCQLIECIGGLACGDPAIGLTLDLTLPQFTIFGHGTPVSPVRCKPDDGHIRPGSLALAVATSQARAPHTPAGRREDRGFHVNLREEFPSFGCLYEPSP